MELKKITSVVSISIFVIILYSCNIESSHPNFKYTSGYFPYQFPVRTLVLGNYIYDNSNDNAHKFIISAHMGGVYKNTKARKFNIKIDNSLGDSLLFNANGDTVHIMPSSYYKLSSSSLLTIAKGKQHGGVTVQLTDAFFKDPKSIGLYYVVPLRLISSSDVDTVLSGKATLNNSNPDPRIGSDWVNQPKNFTLFAVKYINEYDRTYFHFGESKVRGSSNSVIEDSVYKSEYIVRNPTSKLTTTRRHQVSFSVHFYSQLMSGDVKMRLTFKGNDCSISGVDDSQYQISGNGTFKKDNFEWGDKKRDGIVLKYSISDGNYTYIANDTLISRDRNVVLETYNPVKY